MTDWMDQLKKCGEGAAAGAGSGAALDAGTGGATLGFGTLAGALYGCASNSSLDAVAWRGVKKAASAAWSAALDLFGWGDDPPPKAPPSLDFAMARTVKAAQRAQAQGQTELTYRYEVRLTGGRPPVWKDGDPARIWHPANRAALYGEAGVATDPALLFKGLAVSYLRLRPSQGADAALLEAVLAYGDFLKALYPQGQQDESQGSIEDWQPSERLRQLAQEVEDRPSITRLPEQPTSISTGVVLGLTATLLMLLGGGTYLILDNSKRQPQGAQDMEKKR